MMWLALVLTSVSPSNLYAEAIDDLLPAYFKKIQSVSEIEADDFYLIGSEYDVFANGKDNLGFCLLTSNIQSSTLMGCESTYPVAEVINVDRPECLWKMMFQGDSSVVLFSPQKQSGIAQGKSATNLKMSTSKWLKWNVEINPDGDFILKKSSDPQRALALNWMPDGGRFGAYSLSGGLSGLHIYKMVRGGVDIAGDAVLPADGAEVALVVDSKVYCERDGVSYWDDVNPYLLQTNQIAFNDDLYSWTCCYAEDGCFSLADSLGRGLEIIIDHLPEEQLWKVVNGYYATATLPTQYLVIEDDGKVVLKTEEELETIKVKPALLLPIDTARRSETLQDGLKTLSGSWSAMDLAGLDWNDVLALDLTQISLPKYAQSFVNLPKENNVLIYVSEEGKVACPSSWKNIVVCQPPGENTLSGNFEVMDGLALALHRPFSYKENQIVYKRSAFTDDGWETLCLPFEGKLPADFIAERLKEVSSDGSLVFEPVHKIIANEPLILKYTGSSEEEKVLFEVNSDKGVSTPMKEVSEFFIGSYLPLEILKENEGYYFLNSTGTSFVRAAEGSHLSPFRGYVKANRAMRVVHTDAATGIIPLSQGDTVTKKDSYIYTLDGRRITPTSQDELPRGIYIIKGRKFVK